MKLNAKLIEIINKELVDNEWKLWKTNTSNMGVIYIFEVFDKNGDKVVSMVGETPQELADKIIDYYNK